MGREYIHPFAEKNFRQSPLYKKFVEVIKEPWDNQRPADRGENSKIIPGTSYTHFADIYEKQDLVKDEAEINRIKAEEDFDEKTPLGEIGEYIIMEGIYNLQWLSEEVEVMPAHEFDDFIKGTDFVLRFKNKNNTNFYLAVDVTTSQSPLRIKGKRRKILNGLISGDLTELKYFEDQARQVKGETKALKGKKKMPRMAIVLDPDDAERMLGIILRTKKRPRYSPNELENLVPEEKAAIKEDEKEMKFVQRAVEKEFLDQVKENMDFAADLLEEQRIKAEAKLISPDILKQYEQAYNAYKRVYKKIKKEA